MTKSKKITYQVLIFFSTLILSFFIIQKYVFTTSLIEGPSMAPAYKNDEYVLLLKTTTGLKNNDVVVFNASDVVNEKYIKRVIGMPGQSITYFNNHLYRNGIKTDELFLKPGTKTKNYIWMKDGSSIIPQRSYFVMGDNRGISKDSRDFGLVKDKQIIGKVVLRY